MSVMSVPMESSTSGDSNDILTRNSPSLGSAVPPLLISPRRSSCLRTVELAFAPEERDVYSYTHAEDLAPLVAKPGAEILAR